jgi:putative peptide modification system cyclase
MNALAQSAPASPQTSAVPLLRTLVLCDLVDSTALVERLGDQRAADLFRRHDRVARNLLGVHGGREIDKTDGFLLMFDRPVQAAMFALAYQRALKQLGAEQNAPLAARVGIHVGDILTWDNAPDDIAKGAKLVEVEGLVKPIASRLMQLALPNQILLSGVAYSLAHRAQGELGEQLSSVRWRTHGRYRFKGIPDPIPVFEVGEEGLAPLKAPPWSGKAHRETPFWRRPATMMFESLALLAVLAVPMWYAFRPEAAIAFANRDWVVVGDLKNLTGDARFDDSVGTAFRIGLEQSRYVNVLSDLKTRETVQLMQKDPDQTTVDRAIGSEIAIRDGARALILPTIAEIGGRVRVTAEVVDPNTQTTVYSESADGAGAASVLPSLDRINQKLRVRLGEALATVSNESKPLDRVATRNLDALRAYSLGQHACSIGNCKEGLALLQQAVTLDPDFALARVAIAAADNDVNENVAALKQIDLALAGRDRLSTRDAMYVEAWRALFGAPVPALEKWKTLAQLYPDFFAAQGIFGYYAWQYANRYDEAIKSYDRSASVRNPRPQLREYVLGTLYLGQERYAEADLHFVRARELGLQRTEFRAVVPAAQRQFDKLDAALAREKAAPISDNDASSQNLRIAFAADRGRWSDAWTALAAARTQTGDAVSRSRRKLQGVETSLRTLTGADSDTTRIRQFLDGEIAALGSETAIDRAETMFHVLFAGYLAAASGDVKLAQSAIAQSSPEARDGGYPVLSRMFAATQAEIARASGKPDEAIDQLLKQPLDGTELCVTHVALMQAYLAKGDRASAMQQARWLAAHRGRAYTEYNADWIARPFNVAQTDLALLQMAELSLDLGNKQQARDSASAFRRAWPGASEMRFVAPRLHRLDAGLL